MNLATMKQQLLRDLHIDSTTSGSVADSDVSLAIIESIRYNRRFNLGFNRTQCSLITEVNINKYDMPADYLGLCSEVVYRTLNDGTSSGRVLKFRPLDWVEVNRYDDVEGVSPIDLGYPWTYSIDPKGKRLVLSPVPSITGERIEFDYVRDCGTPEFKYTGSAWAFYNPGTTDAIASTFSNEYFTEAYHLIYNRAAFILWSRPYGGTEEAAMRGQTSLQMWAEELSRMRAEANRVVGGNAVRPRL